MRILFDSRQPCYKEPFGTLSPGQTCTLTVHIPATVKTTAAVCLLSREDGAPAMTVPLSFLRDQGPYQLFQGSFLLPEPGLYFYYFQITGWTGTFRLFKQGNDTNMEAGDLWQVSCVPDTFPVPEWAMGAIMYQIFPDRFCRSGSVDLTGKLEPYILHENWNEEICWQPTREGQVLNNDFFGGNFRGITEKMDYLAGLGVDILYLNPICKSFSNHRYDTGDYKTPDPMLGTMTDFTALCNAAHSRGIRVILDGVYSHTGANSLYFNRSGSFPGVGAYQSRQSPYSSWYYFHRWPERYNCWWNFDTLPTVNKLDPSFMDYIIYADDSVTAHWLRAGADGFRLDVADELPNEFLLALKQRLRQLKPDALLIGEVWEDASNKIAYGVRRRYFVDGTLDSIMNYPFRTAILQFLRGQDDGRGLQETVLSIRENYPPQVLHANMNLLGTHDTGRILTALVDEFEGSRAQSACRHLSPEAYARAKSMLMAASFLLYALPGSPCLYYGDEAGMEGDKDPFNRRSFPWGREDPALLEHYRGLGRLRREQSALRRGDIAFFHAGEGRIGFRRTLGNKSVQIYVNCSDQPWAIPGGNLCFSRGITSGSQGCQLQPMGFCAMEG